MGRKLPTGAICLSHLSLPSVPSKLAYSLAILSSSPQGNSLPINPPLAVNSHSFLLGDITKPTDEQLATYESAATTDEDNNTVIANRKSEYGSNTHQIENIIENGLEAEQTRVQTIKEKYPKE